MSFNKKRAQFTHPSGGSALHIKINTGAKSDTIRRIDADGFLVVDMVATNVSDDRGNASVASFFSKFLNVSQRQIEIVGGVEGTEKLICVFGVSVDTLNQIIHDKTTRTH